MRTAIDRRAVRRTHVAAPVAGTTHKKSSCREPLRAWAFAFIAGLILVLPLAAAAADTDDACEPTQVQDWPICSPETMNAASSPMNPLPHLKSRTFARVAGAPLPGRARMMLSGIVSGGGASCASHVAAVTGDADLLRSPVEQRNKKRMAFLRKSMDGKEVPRRLVFQIYTPNIKIQQSGMVMDAFSFSHAGLGGWRANSGGSLKIYLLETGPGALVAGRSYPAFAQATGGEPGGMGWLYTDWQGHGQPVYFTGPVSKQAKAICASLQRDLDRLHGETVAATGDETLRGQTKIGCGKIRETAFSGDKRYVTGRLEGQIHIDTISDGNIAGHFDLSGQAQLTEKQYQFKYDNRTGALSGDRLTNENETRGSLQVTGRFTAPNYSQGYVPSGSAVVVSGKDAVSEENLLHIRSHLPRLEQRNVDWDEPGIRVTFDRPVDPGSLDNNSFYLEYRDVDGRLQKVPVSHARPAPETIRLMPVDKLKDGVRYRVQIQAGNDGVRGQRGEALDAGYSWNFYTTVDLDDDEPMSELSELVDPHEGVEAHVFQVSRDAALVSGKPTMARVYVKWATHYDVASDWQVRKFPASVRIHGNRPDGPVIGQKENVVIQRPDEYSRDDERHAINSVNVYGLDIDAQPDTIFAEVRPKAECDTPQREFYSEALALDYSPLQVTLNVMYYFIPVGEWRDGVPDADRAEAARIVASATRFSTQNMPIIGVNMIPGGDMALSEQWKQDVQDAAHKHPVDIRNKLMQKLEDRMSTADARRSDIIIGFTPFKLLKLGGRTYSHGLFDDDPSGPITFPIPAVAMSLKPEVARLGAIAHEFGHAFGLRHIPTVGSSSERSTLCGGSLPTVPGVGAVAPAIASASTAEIASIQGFRMGAGGRRGANKSVIEGNAQSTSGLVPLMFPCMGGAAPIYVGKQNTFVTQRNYAKLLTNMARYRNQGLFTQRRARIPLMLAANTAGRGTGPQTEKAVAEIATAVQPPARGLLIAGRVSADDAATIDWARRYTGHPRTPEDDGKWRLEAVNAEGATVAQQRFALQTDPNDESAFRIALDDAQDAHTIGLYRDNEPVATLARSEHAPQVQITGVSQSETNRVRIDWTSEDADGDDLTHQLLYAPAQSGPWIALTGGNPRSSITVNRRLLAPGPRPTLKLIASDGFNETATTRPIQTIAGLRVLAHGPVAGADSAWGADDDIYAIFNTDLAADAITGDTFTIEDPAGQRVAASVSYRAADHTATVSADDALAPGTPYTVTLSASIADRYGNTLDTPVTWQVIRRAPSRTPAQDSSRTDATDAASPSDKHAGVADTDSDNPEKGWLELDGKRQYFEIKRCGQKTDKHTGHQTYVVGKGADGLSVMARVETRPETRPTQKVTIRTGKEMYWLSRHETDQGWASNDDEPATGPLIKIRDTRLTIDADLKIWGTKGHKHARIEAACPGLAAGADP